MKPVYKDSAKIFDQYASNYETCVNESLKLMGESVGYFASYKAGYLNRFFSRLGRYPDTILEIGCGIGVLTNALAEILPKHISIVGYDHSSQSIKTARSRAHPSNVCFVNSQDQLIKNPHGLVILANVLHHVPINEQESFLRQACQWTSRAGYIAIFEHNPWNPIILKIVRDCPLDAGVKLLSKPYCLKLAKKTGLNPITQDFIGFFPSFLRWLRPLEPHLKWFPLAGQYAIISQRPR